MTKFLISVEDLYYKLSDTQVIILDASISPIAEKESNIVKKVVIPI